jgi:hypothetical protein
VIASKVRKKRSHTAHRKLGRYILVKVDRDGSSSTTEHLPVRHRTLLYRVLSLASRYSDPKEVVPSPPSPACTQFHCGVLSSRSCSDLVRLDRGRRKSAPIEKKKHIDERCSCCRGRHHTHTPTTAIAVAVAARMRRINQLTRGARA